MVQGICSWSIPYGQPLGTLCRSDRFPYFSAMQSLSELGRLFESYRQAHAFKGQVAELYAPAQYLMDLGGKRIRPLSTLVAHQLYHDEVEPALPAALAIEVFHNFSLMHDDIMDESPLRRDHPTVHMQYNLNAAILSGDWMLIHSYDLLAGYAPSKALPMIKLLNKTGAEVCEGQQRDINFETTMNVTEASYIQMIRDKTAVLLGASLQMGGYTAGASPNDLDALYLTGINAGISFQLMDDYLDAFSPSSGKIKGGDILQNKKTILFIHCLQEANEEDRTQLLDWYQTQSLSDEKISGVLHLFEKYEVPSFVKNMVKSYGHKSMEALGSISVSPGRKTNLEILLTELLNRNK